MDTEKIIEKAKKIYGDKYDYSKLSFVDYDTDFILICKKHGEFKKDYNHFIARKRGCPECKKQEIILKRREKNKEEFIRKAKEKHGDKFKYNMDEYIDYKTKISIYCPKHEWIKITPEKHLGEFGCKKCANEALKDKFSLTKEEFIKKAKEKHGDKFDYSLVDYINMRTKVKIICPKHNLFEITPEKHLGKYGCGKCAKIEIWSNSNRKITTEEFIKRSIEKHGDKYDYSKVECKGCYDLVKIVCPMHGEFIQVARDHYDRGCGCYKCSESHGEKIIASLLKKWNIKSTYQKKFDDLKFKNYLRFDFHIPSYNLLLEFNGEQHYIPIDFSGKLTKEETWQEFLKGRHCDWLKRKYAKKNGYNYLAIRYDENIEEKLFEKLPILEIKKVL